MASARGVEAAVDRQLEAFNARDADAFAAAYAEDAVVVTDTSGDAPLVGREAIRAHYAGMFAALPDLRATVEERTVVGSLVTDRELVAPLNVRAVAVYEVGGAASSAAPGCSGRCPPSRRPRPLGVDSGPRPRAF